jgi:hypothetical protein
LLGLAGQRILHEAIHQLLGAGQRRRIGRILQIAPRLHDPGDINRERDHPQQWNQHQANQHDDGAAALGPNGSTKPAFFCDAFHDGCPFQRIRCLQ